MSSILGDSWKPIHLCGNAEMPFDEPTVDLQPDEDKEDNHDPPHQRLVDDDLPKAK